LVKIAEILENDLSIILDEVGTSISRSTNEERIGNVVDCPYQYSSIMGPIAKNFDPSIL